jgi:PAS domain S-box-containing protein
MDEKTRNRLEQAEKALRATEATFQVLLDSAPDAIILTDHDGQIILVNAETERLFGYHRSELLGQPVELLVPARYRERHVANRLNYLANPRTRPMGLGLDLTGQHKDGSEIPVEISLSPLTTKEGLLVTSVIRNSTERKRVEAALRESERRFRALFHQTFQFIALLRPDGTLLEANRTALDFRGLTPDEVAGRPLWATPWWDDSAATRQQLQTTVARAAQGHFVRYEIELYDRAGVPATFDFSLKPLMDEHDQVVLLIAEGRDITERKRHERQQRERDLLRAEQLVAIGQVAAGVAHELRNPLTSIKGLVQVNRKEAEARGVPAEDLRIIEQEIRRMERTLQTFLEFARPPKPERRLLMLAALIERVFALIGGRAQKQGVELRFLPPPAPVQLEADHDQIQQLLLNLALNALDAMPRGGVLQVVLLPPRDGQVELQVVDGGTGIAADLLPKIFSPFVSNKETGLGLGLAVSRRVAEDHGGTLTAHNRPEGGACFILRLPVGKT